MLEYQNIIISPDVFEYLGGYIKGEPYCDDVDMRSYKQNLKIKRLVLDKREDSDGIYERIKNIIKNSSDLAKDKLQIILDEFLNSERHTFKENFLSREYVKNKEHNYLFNLAESTKTKIINSQKEILVYKSKINEFEILNIEDFIEPPFNSTLFSIKRDIDLTKGTTFNLYEILKYYWINTKTLIVEDDYLRHSKNQFPKLIQLIKTCTSLMSLTIKSLFTDKKQSGGEYKSKLDFEKEIYFQTGIAPILENKKAGERHYITDYFNIHLGKGLDFFNEYYKVWRDKATITIRLKNNVELNC